VRKAAHYLLLIYIKKYEKIDEVMESYVESIEENPEQWKVIQKIIHSFQSLLVIEPKCITYGKNFESMDQFLRLLLAFKTHQHHLIQKASDQVPLT
jgi:thiamine kinase-like enzyme